MLIIRKTLSSRWSQLILMIITFMWGAQLLSSDAYYVNYLLLLAVITVCCIHNYRHKTFVRPGIYSKDYIALILIFSLIFTLMVALANYKVWNASSVPNQYGKHFRQCYKPFLLFCFGVGGFWGFCNFFAAIAGNIKSLNWTPEKTSPVTTGVSKCFWICFFILFTTRMVMLFFCVYPGVLTPDSINQITQILSGNYSNHHPFYHTQVIRLFMTIGFHLFGNINAAVATYSVFQILFTSFCFSFAVSTFARMNAPKWICVISIAFFTLMPYHLMYSITMWKDIMFGCFVLTYILFFYRGTQGFDNKYLTSFGLFLSGMGICLFRSNGFFVFFLLTLAFLLLWKLEFRRFLLLFVLVLISSYTLKHPVLNLLGVSPPDPIESLSIPSQQIARVIQEGYPLTNWEEDLLAKVVDVAQVPETYKPYHSDPIKFLVRSTGDQQFLLTDKWNYAKLYFGLGLRYPSVYLRAWIDQTRGYWNAGYEYWIWYQYVVSNDLGICQTVRNTQLNRLLSEYLWLFTDIHGLRLFLSIGLFVWFDIVLLFVALLKKDKIGGFLTLPVLFIVLSLLIATPIFSEFRYIYAVFCVLPVLLVISFRPEKEN